MSRQACCAFLTAILLSFPLAAQKKPVTVADVSSPRAMGAMIDPVWSPDGSRFVFREGRKLMLYTVAEKKSRELVTSDSLEKGVVSPVSPALATWENRGVREQAIQWHPAGDRLLISAQGELFLVRAGDGSFERLTETREAERDPKLSPDGRSVAFRREHDLYVMDLASKKLTRLTANGTDTLRNAELDWVYPEELALGTAYWWSPDSKSIAYLQFDTSRVPLYPHADLRNPAAVAEPERYPKAGDDNSTVLLGVVPAAGGATKWVDLGETRYRYLVGRIDWTPDSTRLAVQRLNRIQDRLDLLIADPANGETRVVLTETDRCWVNLADDLRFLSGERLLWSSERDGFRHLYLYELPRTGEARQIRQLTRGDWEVRGVAAVDERAGRVYFLSSEASPLETQLYSVRLNGRDKLRVTSEPGSHRVSFAPGAANFSDSYSSTAVPSRVALRDTDGKELAVLRESDRTVMNEFSLLPREVVTIKAADGRTDLYGALIKPAGFAAGKKYPAIVSVYGGPHAQNVADRFGGLSMDQVYAHQGYVVWQLDNRGAWGRGHTFESAVNRQLGVTELADQKAGIEYLRSLGYVDMDRIGISGWSYGGFMTLNAMLNAPGVFRAGIAGAPVTRFANYDSIYTERYMGLPVENPEGYKKTDLTLSAPELKGSLMLVHNIEDDNVLFQNTLQMIDALEKAGKRFELMLYTQKAHGVMGPVRRQMLESMLDFFDRTLKK